MMGYLYIKIGLHSHCKLMLKSSVHGNYLCRRNVNVGGWGFAFLNCFMTVAQIYFLNMYTNQPNQPKRLTFHSKPFKPHLYLPQTQNSWLVNFSAVGFLQNSKQRA
jgi:hypothetical protein